MKFFKIFAMGSVLSWGLSSCVSEQQSWEENEAGKGSTSIDVDMLRPTPTRAVETANFPVKVVDLATNKDVKTYASASVVPTKIFLPVGDYYAEAHTLGELSKIMTYPYYLGRDTFEILQKINTRSNVICRMANGSIKVNLSQEFLAAFKEWTITVDDGGSRAISFTQDSGANPDIVYILFEENVLQLTVNFTGITTTNNRIATSNTLTKKQASEQYDRDEENFSGGDAVVINFTPVESTEGEITGITLTANISFEESEEIFDMEVEDKETTGGGDNPGSGEDNPGGGEAASITLDLPEDMVVNGNTEPSLGDTYIKADKGIKSITVSIESTSKDMMESLQAIAAGYEGVDFVAGTEIVGNDGLAELFSGLGQTLSTPSAGDTEYTFPIGNFFVLLSVLPGEHTFNLTVTDMDDNTKSGVLVLTVE